MLYFIGTGLTPDSLSLRAMRIIGTCKYVFLDSYTSILVSFEQMKVLIEDVLRGKEVIQADRKMVEVNDHEILDKAQSENVAFLVVGDAMCATTHNDLFLRATKRGIAVQVIPNASIINAISSCGVEMYSVGRTISVPFFTDTWKPASFVDRIIENYNMGLHSLMLMDIKTKEPNIMAMMRGVEKYDPPRYMLSNTCCQQICEVIDGNPDVAKQFSKKNLAICLMRVGTDDQKYICSSIEKISQMGDEDMGAPLHSVLILGKDVCDMEAQMFSLWVREGDKETAEELQKYMR